MYGDNTLEEDVTERNKSNKVLWTKVFTSSNTM